MVVRRMSSLLAHNGRVRVLVVEDHVALAGWIGEGLRDAGFAVDVVLLGWRRRPRSRGPVRRRPEVGG